MRVPEAVRSEAKVLAACLLRSRVGIPLRTWMFVPCLYLFCCPGTGLATSYHLSKESCNVCVRNKWVMERAWSLQ
jgi:hypothetical protein